MILLTPLPHLRVMVSRKQSTQRIYCVQKIQGFDNGYIDGLVQDCSNSIANTLELLQSCTKPSTCCFKDQANLRTVTVEQFAVIWAPWLVIMPGSQDVQVVVGLDASLYVPSGHGVHGSTPDVDREPSGHSSVSKNNTIRLIDIEQTGTFGLKSIQKGQTCQFHPHHYH